MAAGVELPRAIVAHGMWVDPIGRKMSKTLGNVIELDVLHKHFSIDAIRYFCSARNGVWAGWPFWLRSIDRSREQRSRERVGKSLQPHADDDRALLRLANSVWQSFLKTSCCSQNARA